MVETNAWCKQIGMAKEDQRETRPAFRQKQKLYQKAQRSVYRFSGIGR
jgi:hypothetical protein